MRAIVIGAGIGGLSCAIALEKVGIEAEVFEHATKLAEVGAGLGLWSSAIRCLRALDVRPFWERSVPVRFVAVSRADAEELARTDVGAIADAIGAQSYVVHRAELHEALAEKVWRVRLGARCVSIEDDGTRAVARFEDGSHAQGDLLIGADGLRSAVRAALFGEQAPLYSGQTCYRGVARMAHREPEVLREVQGPKGLRCAVCALDRERVYWWATRPAPEGERDEPGERRVFLRNLFCDFNNGIGEALEATAAEAILRHDLYDRDPIERWSRGRVTLLGDAAHPTTPNLGQGACMAMEDAIVLARALSRRSPIEAALGEYEAQRRPRTSQVVRMSRRLGQIGSWRNPVAVFLREVMTRVTPASTMEDILREQIGYDAGSLQP